MDPTPHYDDDLAAIHDAGFGDVAEAAAGVLLDSLEGQGRIIELGCGPGLSARRFADAGFSVLGFDSSPAMIALARRRVPAGDFRIASFVDADLPAAVAVAAFGEVLNYAFDEANDDDTRRLLFSRVRQSLPRGGLFVFDVAGPARAPEGRRQVFREGDGWAVLAESKVADHRILTRRITTFRREPDGRYRRRQETHRQLLLDPGAVRLELETAGFLVETADRYGALALPAGLTVFHARAR